MREYAAKIEAVNGGPDGDKKALEEWRKVVRHEAWRTIVKYMRSMHYSVFPLESPMNLDAIDWTDRAERRLQLLQRAAGRGRREVPGRELPAARRPPCRARPTTTARRSASPSAPSSASSPFREQRAGARAGAGAEARPYLWGADVRRNLIVRLDPRDGRPKWYPGRLQGLDRPAHDRAGRRRQSVGHDGRQRPVRPLRPEDREVEALDAAADEPAARTLRWRGAAIVHDMSIDSRGHMARDAPGNVWLTHGRHQPDGHAQSRHRRGRVLRHEHDRRTERDQPPDLLHGAVARTASCAWYSQVNGSVGCIDTRTKKSSSGGAVPRRHRPASHGPRQRRQPLGRAVRQRAGGEDRHGAGQVCCHLRSAGPRGGARTP